MGTSNKSFWQMSAPTGNRCLTFTEERLLRKTMGRRKDAARDFAVFRALLTTGMRINEFLSLTLIEAKTAIDKGCLFLEGSRRKSKTLPSGKVVFTDLFINMRGEAVEAFSDLVKMADKSSEYLVQGRADEPLTPRAYQLRLKKWAKEAGVDDRLSPHWLRHTFGAEFCRKSAASPTETCIRLSKLLGHSSPVTCAHYLTMTRDDDPGAAVEAVWRCRKRITKTQARRAFVVGRAAV